MVLLQRALIPVWVIGAERSKETVREVDGLGIWTEGVVVFLQSCRINCCPHEFRSFH